MDNEVVKILLDIQKDVSATKTAVEALAGRDGRVTQLEEAADRQFWYTMAVVPVFGLLHAFARKFGVNV